MVVMPQNEIGSNIIRGSGYSVFVGTSGLVEVVGDHMFLFAYTLEKEIDEGGAEDVAKEIAATCKPGPGVVAIVSMVEFPSDITSGALAKLPPLLVYSTTSVDHVRGLASEGAIHTAILPRDGVDPDAASPHRAPAAEIVDELFETLTR